jgi:hypothetical protein
LRALASYGQIAGGHELTSCRRSHAMYLGDHRLGQAMDTLHHLGAAVKKGLEKSCVSSDHLAEIMTGRKRRTGALKHDHTHLWLAACASQRSKQLVH